MLRTALISTGEILTTQGAENAIAENLQHLPAFLKMHAAGIWGEVTPNQYASNQRALWKGGACRSTYRLRNGKRIFVQTDRGRYTTLVRLAREV